MALPIIPLATFDVKHKSLPNGKIVMKPFTTGQETVLLQVKDSEKKEEILGAIKQIIKECVVEPANFDVSKIPTFAIEYIFIKIRERSNGEIVELAYRCTNKIKSMKEDEPEKVCGGKIEFKLDLRDVTIDYPEGSTDVFKITEDIGLKLFYPSLETSSSMESDEDAVELIVKHIDSIFDGDTVYNSEDSTEAEKTEFVKQIPSKVKNEIMSNFFNKLPTVKYKTSQVCPDCGMKHDIVLEGMSDFFH